MKIDYLLSGLCGALIVSLFNYVVEQVRYRKEAMMEVVAWGDRIYTLLRNLHVYKDKIYKGQGKGLNADDYRAMNMELVPLLTTTRIIALVHLTYGEGIELKQVHNLQNELKKVSSLFMKASPENWTVTNEEIRDTFQKKIDPLRGSIHVEFAYGTRVDNILRAFCRHNLPTIISILKRVHFKHEVKSANT